MNDFSSLFGIQAKAKKKEHSQLRHPHNGVNKHIYRLLLSAVLLLCSGCSLLDDGEILSGTILFEDQFVIGETGNWLTETDGEGQTLVINEALVIQLNEPNIVQYTTLQEPSFGDFILEFEATLLAGSKNSTYGILLRMVDNEQFYRFSMTGNGVFVIEKHMVGGTLERLTDNWEEASPILQGTNQTNQVRIEAIGPQIDFYVNSQLVRTIIDPDYSNGRIAFSSGTFNTDGTQVAFDNVSVKQP